MIDTLRKVSTPEGVELELRVAGLYARCGAIMLDLTILIVGLSIAGAIFSVGGDVGGGLFLVLAFTAWWFYPVFCEVMFSGATFGKQAFGLRVVHRDGTPVSWGSSLTRNLLLTADLLPPVGMTVMFLSRDSSRLGDLLAGTVVVYRDDRARRAELPSEKPVMPRLPLHQHEQRALLEFAERLEDWSPKRQEELADLLEPLTKTTGQAGIEQLTGIVTYLMEGR